MKRSDAISELSFFLNDLYDCDSFTEEEADKILNFIETKLSMNPPQWFSRADMNSGWDLECDWEPEEK